MTKGTAVIVLRSWLILRDNTDAAVGKGEIYQTGARF